MKRLLTQLNRILILWFAVSFADTAVAQIGVPFFRNFMSTDYNAQRKNFDILCDDKGFVFVANMEGILCYDFEHWTTIHLPGYERVTAISKDDNGRIWFKGIESTGYIEVGEKGSQTAVIAPADESMFAPNSKLTFGQNEVFESVSGQGLHIYNKENRTDFYLTTINGLCSNNINAICADKIGNIWGATDNGIFMLKYPTAYGRFTPHEGLHGEVKCVDKYKGIIYVGTNQGLFKQVDNISMTKVEGVIGCHQLKKHEGNLLIAAANGLFLFDGATLKQISNHFVVDVKVQDGHYICTCQDGIWLIEKNGSSRLIDQVTREKLFEAQYTLPSGWSTDGKGQNLQHDGGDVNENGRWLGPYKDYTVNAVFADNDILLVGTDNGLFTADRNYQKYTISMEAPTLHFGKIIYFTDTVNVVWNGFPNYVQEETANLPSNTKFVKINFATKRPGCFSNSLYSYRTDGGTWSRWLPENSFLYNNPGYGKHVFEVKTKNAYGMESEPISFDLYVGYPLYLRWYAIVFYILLLLYFTYQAISWRTNKLKEESERLEKMVEERTAELRDTQKELVRSEKMATVGKLTQGLIDRILNPMNYINNFSKLNIGLLSDLKENVEDVKDNIDEDIYDDCADIVSMLEQNLAKISDHGMNTTRILKAMEGVLKEPKINIAEHNLTMEINSIVESARSAFSEQMKISSTVIEYLAPNENIVANCDSQALSRVMQSMILNSSYAINKRFEKDNTVGKIVVDLSRNAESIVIAIKDNGIGIEDTILDKIFDPFFTTKTTSEAAGVGLYLCRNIISMMNGDIVVTSEKNKFTEFKIVLWQK